MQIFTNADEAHAAQVLHSLDLEDCFEGVICFETLNNSSSESKYNGILCKPSIEAIQAAIKIADIDPEKTVRRQALLLVFLLSRKLDQFPINFLASYENEKLEHFLHNRENLLVKTYPFPSPDLFR